MKDPTTRSIIAGLAAVTAMIAGARAYPLIAYVIAAWVAQTVAVIQARRARVLA